MNLSLPHLWVAYRMRMKRRRLILRSLLSSRNLTKINDRTAQLRPDHIRAFTTIRNEYERLPYFLKHYRSMGVGHFFFVLNNSTDGSEDYLKSQPDVSLWSTQASYKASRYGVDWTTFLQFHYGHNAWCLCVDADELLVYPYCDKRSLIDLSEHLDATGVNAFGALMLDMFPKGPLNKTTHTPGQNPIEVLPYFDTGPFTAQRQHPAENLWLQGGTRQRVFFHDKAELSPTLNKIPFMRWNRRFAYLNSTHSLLPPRLNHSWNGPRCISDDPRMSGVLLHTKFLPNVVKRSLEEKHRQEHFGAPEQYDSYYERLCEGPDLWHAGAQKYRNWQQLDEMGLLSAGQWG